MWLFKKTPEHLPEAKGPYVPGCQDVMLGYSKSGLFFRLYYPTNQKRDEPYSHKWIKWLTHPETIDGYGRILMIWPIFLRICFWWMAADSAWIPVLYGDKPKTDKKLKCVIVSHGYAGHRAFYTMICNELASRGFLVAAIEHRDHSASFTHYYQSEEDVKNDRKIKLQIQKLSLGERNFEQRVSQLMIRAAECEKLLDFLIDLNNGVVPMNVLDHSSHHENIDVNLKDFIGNIDVGNITMMGHSFGGATALYALSQRKELGQGILLDPWMFALKEKIDLHKQISGPLLFINTKTFHIAANVRAMEKFLHKETTEMFTMQHTTHESQTDTAFLIGYWLNWFMKKIDPARAAHLNNAIMLRFLKKYVDPTLEIEDCEQLLLEESNMIVEGLTQPWA